MIAISGNTYPVKDAIKALGGRWKADAKSWMVPDAKADEARKLVAGAPVQPKSSSRPHYRTCHECGAPSRGYYRCYECSLDYREGGGMYNGGMSYRDSRGNFVLGDDD
jgi:hypothetical protein